MTSEGWRPRRALLNELRTVGDMLRWLATQFSAEPLHYGHGTADAWDEALALLRGVLRLPDEAVGQLLPTRLTRMECNRLIELANRRVGARVPVPYLVGAADYCGLTLTVTPDVLIPRSPIGHLLLDGMAPWITKAPTRVLDLCTGSGAIGIVAALAWPEAEVWLSDISPAALAIAEQNAHQQGVADRCRIVEGDLWHSLPATAAGTFDLIVSNPPYVPASRLAELPAEYTHEPPLGLVAAADGKALASAILADAAAFLTAGGLLVLEVGEIWEALDAAHPRLPLTWLELPDHAEGVALIDRQGLLAAA